MIASIWVAIHFQNPAHAFIIGLLSSFGLIVSQTVKSWLREARPFMIYESIKVADCGHVEFGNPSSHTFLSAAMLITNACLFYREWCYFNNKKQKLIHILLLLNTVFIVVYLIGFSRVFKGVHSYNQIIGGFVEGLLVSLLPSFVFYQDLFRFYISLKKRSVFSIIFNWVTVSFLILLLITYYVHLDTQNNFKVPKNWLVNVKKQCPHLDPTKFDFEYYNFKKIENSFHFIGSYLGMVYDRKISPERKNIRFNRT